METNQKQINKYCSYCGKETWACSHGGHCYSEIERREWEKNFGKSTDYPGFPEFVRYCKVRITLHTYRQGGSMICDKQIIGFTCMPTQDELDYLISVYKESIDYEGDVFFNISGRMDGEVCY